MCLKPHVLEVGLAHSDKDEVRSAYNRIDDQDRRCKVMAWWSEHNEHAANLASALTWKPVLLINSTTKQLFPCDFYWLCSVAAG